MKHKTKDGKLIDLKDLEDNHLDNIIQWKERRAKEGVLMQMGSGTDPDNIWYDEETVYGQEALDYLNYHEYVAERNMRNQLRSKL